MAWVWPDEPLPGEGKQRRRERINANKQRQPPPILKDKSEQGGIDFRTYENLTSLTAPFGTSNTPVIGTKIIGGQQVSVIEHLSPNQYNGNGGISISKLNDIADKPNNVNPDVLRRGARGYFSAQQPKDDFDQEPVANNHFWDNFQSNLHGKPTYVGRSRPDSKSLARGLKLDPLTTNKNKNQLSTIFEPEIGNPNALQLETEYGDKYMKDTEYERPISDQHQMRPNGRTYDSTKFPKALSDIGPHPISNDYQSHPPAKDVSANSYSHNDYIEQTPRTVLNEERNRLLKYLWSANLGTLPQRPIELTQVEEEKLGHIVSVELDGIPRKRLDKVHADAITSDWAQNGTCALVAMKKALESNQIRLDPDTVRLVAAKFVDRNQNGWIFYRDFIRYLKKFLPKEPQSSFEQQLQSRTNSPMDDLNPQIHRTFGKTLQIAKQQLADEKIRINMSAIRKDFESRDKPYRGRLSEHEILDVLRNNKVNLPSDVFKDLLYMKRRRPHDGQFDWEAFLGVLEMIQPDATGLDIPRSKRPLEYAKPTLETFESWPRSSPRRDYPSYNGYRQQSDRPPEDNWQHNGYQPSFSNRDTYNQGYNGNMSYRREPSPSRAQQMSYRSEDEKKGKVSSRYPPITKYPPPESPRQLQDEIYKMENEIKALQERNEKLELMRQKQEERQELFSTITSLGKTLYGIDELRYRSSGRVYIDEVLEESVKHRLPLPRKYLQDAADKCMNAKRMVDIQKYLDLVKALAIN
ncbi:uncharacterized protein LOC132545645 [Ylistrum balloti]|uniref:uncharacterized protein LOC132545645 n=1 Tax=Ylistrum balloti TaxID=509963 RepID=UPI00290584B2|nr:uncharacterized protein LOC132545645 [Ylistrum balloti]